VLGYGSALAVVLSAFNYTGGKFLGTDLDKDVDEVSRKEHMRKNRRRSIEETVNELGEGRGAYFATAHLGALLTVVRRVCSRICREESAASQRHLRHRCHNLSHSPPISAAVGDVYIYILTSKQFFMRRSDRHIFNLDEILILSPLALYHGH
jgi:hypothetical protein